ncbi:c-type cytochrome [Shewanella glacialipiscicola]|uniref:c-type cytochrome n=1 Tax=Shewanella glacialipiscicola TaxID=614069 RepID=UPI003D7AAF17
MKYSAMLLLAATGLFTLQAQASSTEQAPERPDKQAPLPSFPKMPEQTYLTPRPLSAIPDGAFGDKVRLGYQLFVNTQQLRDKYVGNELNCTNCHMDAGRKANASPLWGAYFAYPAYRKKDDKVSSFEERIQGCFNYSMNGKAPASGSPELVALSAYAYWLGMGGLMDEAKISGPVPELSDTELLKGAKREDFPLPEGLAKVMTVEQRANLPGRAYPEIPKPELAYSPERGKEVYVAYCQTCHSVDGQGQAIAGVYALPPLWGPKSYNWGAGMHRVNTAAFFIYENMPFGKSMQLTHQQAWDVAAYINSHERPQDPRSKGDVKQAQEKYHNDSDYYGLSVDGKVLGTESYPVFPKKS